MMLVYALTILWCWLAIRIATDAMRHSNKSNSRRNTALRNSLQFTNSPKRYFN